MKIKPLVKFLFTIIILLVNANCASLLMNALERKESVTLKTENIKEIDKLLIAPPMPLKKALNITTFDESFQKNLVIGELKFNTKAVGRIPKK